MIVLKWLGTEKYYQDGISPTLIDINTKKRWDWGFVEKALNLGEDVQILGKAEEEEK